MKINVHQLNLKAMQPLSEEELEKEIAYRNFLANQLDGSSLYQKVLVGEIEQIQTYLSQQKLVKAANVLLANAGDMMELLRHMEAREAMDKIHAFKLSAAKHILSVNAGA